MRAHIHVPQNIGERIADSMTSFLGSWWCVGLHAWVFFVWFVIRGDVNLLTLIVSLEAIFLSTFVMMSQNRTGAKDRIRDDHEAQTVDLMAADHKLLMQINRQQLEILERLP